MLFRIPTLLPSTGERQLESVTRRDAARHCGRITELEKGGNLEEREKKLATGGTVSEGEVEVQGDHRDRVVEMLKALGYSAKAAGG